MSKPISTVEQVSQWLDAILTDGVNLTVWEESFIDSVNQSRDSWGERWQPTERQREQIERIYAERVP